MGNHDEAKSLRPLYATLSIAAGMATAGLALGLGAVLAARTMARAMST